MWVAIDRDNGDAIRLLLDAGDEQDACGERVTPLLYAASLGRVEAVRTLLACGAQIDMPCAESAGMSPLLVAAWNKHAAIVRILLWAGANKEACHVDGSSALLLASASGDIPTIRLLLQAGLNPNKSNLVGTTPLMAAAQAGHVAALGVLVDTGASLEARDEELNTALILAAEEGRSDVVRALCELGADVHAKNKSGATAEKMSVAHDHLDCQKILKAVREQEQLLRTVDNSNRASIDPAQVDNGSTKSFYRHRAM
jgi:ankyrin repeat protein